MRRQLQEKKESNECYAREGKKEDKMPNVHSKPIVANTGKSCDDFLKYISL